MFISFRKTLFNQKIFGVLSKKPNCLSSFKFMSQIARDDIGLHAEVPQEMSKFLDKEKQYCQNFLENETSQPVQWECLEENLRLMKSANIRSTVFKSCQVLQNGYLAIDYCQYILNKGEKLSFVEICLLIKALARSKINLQIYDKLIKTIFDHSHDKIFTVEVVVKEAIDVFSQNKACCNEIFLKYKMGKIHSNGIEKLIATAFDMNKPDIAWEIANENPEKFFPSAVESYFRYCIRLAKEKKFSSHLIDDVINFSKTHTVVLKCDNFYNYLHQLTTALNDCQTQDFLWSIDKCDIIKTDLCSSCQYRFQPETITATELEELKQNFLKKVMICYNINMKTTPRELETFFNFLEKCRPYDIVIDVLNLFFGSQFKKTFRRRIISYFEKKKMRILLIARSHFKNSDLYNQLKSNHQIFLTRNDSVDDLFCLYAAMHQGPNTYFCTSDFLRDHAKFFDDCNLYKLFHKWQISHQYVVSLFGNKVIHPRSHSDLSQSSVVLGKNNDVKEYRWHLSYLNHNQNFRLENPAQWVCLRAVSKAYWGKGY